MKITSSILIFIAFVLNITSQASLELVGILDLDLPEGGSSGKAIHLKANQYITNLSDYGIGIANNGGGTDGQEYDFPNIVLNSGDHIIVCRDTLAIKYYFSGCNSFNFMIQDDSSVITQNGDDAVELYENGIVIETFGDVNIDGTGELWEYKDSWAYKIDTGSIIFSGFSWITGGVDCTDFSVTSLSSNCPYPFCSQINTDISILNPLSVAIYPNPCLDKLFINSKNKIKLLEILNIRGQIVSSFCTNQSNIDVSNLELGIYFIKVSNNENISLLKFFKN
ncbi:MAG: T9SS type A sorting domain-containing protein [Flavobacteriales bacterium]|nr:T9SS type A sorting domain-containing protein [Flavobacteriales bacterium]